MSCDHCGAGTVGFAVPSDLREYVPNGAATATICSSCLRVEAGAEADLGRGTDADAASGADPDDADLSAVVDSFPSGRGGVAVALLLGKLDSLALNRAAISALAGAAERAGADPFLTLDRLASTPGVEPHFDIHRRRPQLEQMIE